MTSARAWALKCVHAKPTPALIAQCMSPPHLRWLRAVVVRSLACCFSTLRRAASMTRPICCVLASAAPLSSARRCFSPLSSSSSARSLLTSPVPRLGLGASHGEALHTSSLHLVANAQPVHAVYSHVTSSTPSAEAGIMRTDWLELDSGLGSLMWRCTCNYVGCSDDVPRADHECIPDVGRGTYRLCRLGCGRGESDRLRRALLPRRRP